MTRERERRPRGAGLAIVLIVVGVLILLANFGWFDWFTLIRLGSLWPVLLVAIGADMLTRGRYRIVVWGAAVVVGALLYAYDAGGPRGAFVRGPAETHSIAHPLAGADAADVSITTSVGTLRLSGLSSGGDLVRGTIETRRGETLVDELSKRGGTAVLSISSKSSAVNLRGNEGRSWDLQLTRAVPIALDITTGVGKAQLELRSLQLSRLTMEAGVGEVTATLPDRGVYQADFKAGVGATHITIPSSMAARVTVKSGLGSVHVNGTFARSGDVYETPGYASASDRVDLNVQGGLGQITVNH
ncbi:MAG: toast rack family protein [Deinococcales bacterium]